MIDIGVDIVELGFRSKINKGFKGPFAFTTEQFLQTLKLPKELSIAVMINAKEIVSETCMFQVLQDLFPVPADKSYVDLVRIACHSHEFKEALKATKWLKENGYSVGFNLMQIAELNTSEVIDLVKHANNYPIDVLYFADSMGSMKPTQVKTLTKIMSNEAHMALGIHTHDNKGLALANTLEAIDNGVSWIDATVTGMGRGPGNAKTEEAAIEISELRNQTINLVPLMKLLSKHFLPMQTKYRWGKNTYYYLAGKYGIHPTYIQEMLNDSRYSEEDILAVVEHLRIGNGKNFNLNTLDAARHFFQGEVKGRWNPESIFKAKEILLLGTGPGVESHQKAIESYIQLRNPVVVALNTQSMVEESFINYRIACHPMRLLADLSEHLESSQPLITPYSMLSPELKNSLKEKEILDFGIQIESNCFEFNNEYCVIPTSLVIAYALAMAASGKANRVLLAGFDGYPGDDSRNHEINSLLRQYRASRPGVQLLSVTPSRYEISTTSIYGLIQ
jgi:4-hydroxy 2-oxovalerate aldolase